MYFIIYRYILKPGSTFDEVSRWMRSNEALQAQWGALEADFYHRAGGISPDFFARYKVKSVDRWCEGLSSSEAEEMLENLGELVDTSKTETWIFEEIPY